MKAPYRADRRPRCEDVLVADDDWTGTTATSADEIVEALRASTAFTLSDDPWVEHLLEHCLQTAALLRQTRPDDLELQLAGLVHDLGHILGPRRDDVHAEVAAEFVGPVLGPRVAALVRLHVPAKRYLVTTEPRYREGLDAGSIVSLEHQGGVMDGDEIAAFESEEYVADALLLRRADEAGKVPGLVVPGLDSWLVPLRSHNFQRQG
jgi:predicted HD phosphohydrolase